MDEVNGYQSRDLQNVYPDSDLKKNPSDSTVQKTINTAVRHLGEQIPQPQPIREMGFFARIWTYISHPTTAKIHICARKIFGKDSAKEMAKLLIERHGKKNAQKLIKSLSNLKDDSLNRAVDYLKVPIPKSIENNNEDIFLRDLSIISCCRIFEPQDLVSGVNFLETIANLKGEAGKSWIKSGNLLAEKAEKETKITSKSVEATMRSPGYPLENLIKDVLENPIPKGDLDSVAKKFGIQPGKMRRSLDLLTPYQKDEALEILKSINPQGNKEAKFDLYILRLISAAASETMNKSSAHIAKSTLEALAKNDENSKKIASQLEVFTTLAEESPPETQVFFGSYLLKTQFEGDGCQLSNLELIGLIQHHEDLSKPEDSNKELLIDTHNALKKIHKDQEKVAFSLRVFDYLAKECPVETQRFFGSFILKLLIENASCDLSEENLLDVIDKHRNSVSPQSDIKINVNNKDVVKLPKGADLAPRQTSKTEYLCSVNLELFENLFGREVDDHLEFNPEELSKLQEGNVSTKGEFYLGVFN